MNIEEYRGLVDQTNNTMKSTDLHKFVYEATGKYEKLHNFHLKVRNTLELGDDLKMKSYQTLSNPPQLDSRGYVSWYNLDEVECNMIMASIDVNHLRLMAEVFVKVKNAVAVQDSYQIEDPINRAERWIEEQKEKQLALAKIERDQIININYLEVA